MKIESINDGLERALQSDRIQHLASSDDSTATWAVVHPEPDALILTVGEVRDGGGIEQLLLRRWQEPARYGMWLPLLMRDGQLALACHRPRREGRVEFVSEADWAALLELLQ